MHDLSKIKSTVAHDPLPFLAALYGDQVRRIGNSWRVGSKGGRCFDTRKDELLCVTFNGDAGQGDCIEVWKMERQCDFPAAVEQIAALYGISPGASSVTAPPVPKSLRPAAEARITQPLDPWPLLKGNAGTLWSDAVGNLRTNPTAQATIAKWRGWPAAAVQQLAIAQLIGYTEFDLWPKVIAAQPAAFFCVLHPAPNEDASFWHYHPVQLHVRFLPGACWQNDQPLSWIYVPTMKELAATDGAHAPLVLAHWSRDPEQLGWKQHCATVIVCAGEWDALTVVIAMDWIDANGILTIPKGLAIVGIRSEGRGGTDAFLRRYRHWKPRAAILIADADATGASWFSSTDSRPCFAEQLEQRGIRVLARAPKRSAQCKDEHELSQKTSLIPPETPAPKNCMKDVNDLYRAGILQPHHIHEMLTDAGFSMKGAAQ